MFKYHGFIIARNTGYVEFEFDTPRVSSLEEANNFATRLAEAWSIAEGEPMSWSLMTDGSHPKDADRRYPEGV